jgi:hypothetical protein
MPFREFSRGEIDLSYLNTTVRVKWGDLYFIHSLKCSTMFVSVVLVENAMYLLIT